MQKFAVSFSILACWLINPLFGLMLSLIILVSLKTDDKNYLLIATLIGLTVCFYQLVLPMPYDLEHTIKIYKSINFSSANRLGWIARDPLSYGTLSFLSFIFPKYPITFYILSLALNFICLWMIFKNESKPNLEKNYVIGLFFIIFLGIVDYSDSHHYMRQTTAILICLVATYYSWRKVVVLLPVAILWHGSAILFAPYFLLRNRFRNNKTNWIILLIMFTVAAIVSQINIYEFFNSPNFNNFLHDFNFTDRFLTYFQEPRHKTYFNLSKEIGNPTFYIYLILAGLTTVYGFVSKRMNSLFFFTLTMTFWMIIFHHHILIFSRIVYGLEIILFFYWGLQIQYIRLQNLKLIPISVFILILLKIHFNIWPINLKLGDDYLLTLSPVTMIRSFSNWEINKTSDF